MQYEGYVLGTWKYSETSLIASIFTPYQGKVRLLALGALRPKSHYSKLLQPFLPLRFGIRGRGELKKIAQIDLGDLQIDRPISPMSGLCGLYANELILKCLEDSIPYESLYHLYSALVARLYHPGPLSRLSGIRAFEQGLLKVLGYAPQFPDKVEEEMHYHFTPGKGLEICQNCRPPCTPPAQGKHLKEILDGAIRSPEAYRLAKWIFTSQMAFCMGNIKLNAHLLLKSLEEKDMFRGASHKFQTPS